MGRKWVAEAGRVVRQYKGEYVGLCDDASPRWRRFLKRLDEDNPKSAMISCNDGFRPVSIYIEALDEDAD